MMDSVKGFFSGFFCLLLVSVLSLLGVAITLNLTVLNPDFVVAELKQLGIYSMLTEQLESFLAGQGISGGSVEAALSGLEPELEEEIGNVVRSIYRSIDEGTTDTAIYLGGIKQIIQDYAARAASLSPELQNAPTGDMEAVVSRIYSEIGGIVPDTLLLSESSLGAGVVSQFGLINRITAYLRIAPRVLIIPAVVLVLLVCLVHWWQPKPITRAVGAAFITVGVGCVVVSFFGSLGDVLLGHLPVPPDAYSQFQSSLLRLFNDILRPMRMYGFGFVAVGICLVIVSVLWRAVPSEARTRPDRAGGWV